MSDKNDRIATVPTSIQHSVRLLIPPLLTQTYARVRHYGVNSVVYLFLPPIIWKPIAGIVHRLRPRAASAAEAIAAPPEPVAAPVDAVSEAAAPPEPVTAAHSSEPFPEPDAYLPQVRAAQPDDPAITGWDEVQIWPPAPINRLSFVDLLKAALPASTPDAPAHGLTVPYGVDLNARIFWWNGEPYRAVNTARSALYNRLFDTGVLPALIDKGLLAPTERTDLKIDGYDLILRQRRIPVVSYPFEWSGSMLKDAAMLVLTLEAELRQHDLTLLDPHPWNVLFDGARPVYVDIGSIVPRDEQPGWPQQKFFRHFFTYPIQLMAQGAYGRVARWLMQGFNAPELIVFMGQIALRPHHNQPAPGDEMPAADTTPTDAASTAEDAPEVVPAEADGETPPDAASERSHIDDYDDLVRLRSEIERIGFSLRQTEWSNYDDDRPRDFADRSMWTQKERTVDQVLAELRPETVVDIGSNRGWFSKLAVQHGSRVVAFDVDEPSIETLYHDARAHDLPLLPLMLDFVFASPSFGPAYSLYPSAADRVKSDLVLAIALTHHLVFKQRLSFEQIVDSLKLYTCRWLLVEFAPPTDGDVSQSWSEQTHPWYTLENFRAVLEKRFTTVREYPSAPEPRVMFLCEV